MILLLLLFNPLGFVVFFFLGSRSHFSGFYGFSPPKSLGDQNLIFIGFVGFFPNPLKDVFVCNFCCSFLGDLYLIL